ncbi:MAG TPA: chemoreceptor glutamine deamidase CheD [Burkholderiales bacterium]|nr:chemoreceptor glutamine deamidase CheD [Burkholderiales bacterium]
MQSLPGLDVTTPSIYFDARLNTEVAKIFPGQYFVTDRDIVLLTVLGSCVAACIRDATAGIAGMNHFLLPESAGDLGPASRSARYGTHAMEVLINQLIQQGARKQSMEAKVFGGGNMLPDLRLSAIGESNARFIVDYLSKEGIRVAASDLLDQCARKIYFFPATGRVLVKKLRQLQNDTVLAREQDYRQQLNRTEVSGGVELFR